jgi:uncharacterized membrane protein
MILVLAWVIVALGIIHCLLGFILFRQPIAAAIKEGLFGRFVGIIERRVAFWFTIFGPMLLLSGHVLVNATSNNNFSLVRIVSSYLFAVSIIGAIASPKSPFSVTLIVTGLLMAASFGMI